jgi:hypothetical protein
MVAYSVVDDALSPDFPLGDSLEVFVRCEDAERFASRAARPEPLQEVHSSPDLG